MELRETRHIKTAAEVEERIYHAFKVFRSLPPVKPKGYFNIFNNLTPGETKAIVYGYEMGLAMEICDIWWDYLNKLNDPEMLEIIKYRCGAPIIKNGIEVYGWTGIRPWKQVAKEFGLHRNTCQRKWNKAIKTILGRR